MQYKKELQKIAESIESLSKQQNCSASDILKQLADFFCEKQTESNNDETGYYQVSLIKDGFTSKPEKLTTSTQAFVEKMVHTPVASSIINRKLKIENQMKEISLLIQTAENESMRNKYAMQYALLASELDALL